MKDSTKSGFVFAGWMALTFFIGIVVGLEESKGSLQKEIVELSIELTKLEIKRLKGLSNGS